jgi:hypothetical protein
VSACARCGTAHERSKEFCLSCGIRLPARAARWQRSGLHRANPLWSALAILVLGALGALAAIVLARRDTGGETLVATNLPARTVLQTPPVIGTLAAGVPTTIAPPLATTTAPPPAANRPKVTTLTEWTASDGYTIVLASIPSANGRANAEEFAKQALAKGLAHVGVLDSQDFSSLHPGYFVVFSGFYRSNGAAASHISQVEAAGLGPAYARRITR